MYKILDKKVLGPNVKQFVIDAPAIARKRKPGQFVMIRTNEPGERFPLTIADADTEKETITIIFQEVGKIISPPEILNGEIPGVRKSSL